MLSLANSVDCQRTTQVAKLSTPPPSTNISRCFWPIAKAVLFSVIFFFMFHIFYGFFFSVCFRIFGAHLFYSFHCMALSIPLGHKCVDSVYYVCLCGGVCLYKFNNHLPFNAFSFFPQNCFVLKLLGH